MNAKIRNAQKGYYTNKLKKVVDFFIGLIGVWLVNGLIVASSFSLIGIFNNPYSYANSMGVIPRLVFSIIIYLIPLVIIISSSIYFFKFSRRRYIGIGILSGVLIPLLIFGSCFLLIMGMNIT